MTACFDVQRVEQIDDVAGVVVDRRRRRIAGAAVEAAQLRRDHAPAGVGERELRLPHARVERKGVEQHERAARARSRGSRHRFEITRVRADAWHAPLQINVDEDRGADHCDARHVRVRRLFSWLGDARISMRGARLELWAELGLIVFGALLPLAAAFVRVRLPGGLALAIGAMLGLQALAVHDAVRLGGGVTAADRSRDDRDRAGRARAQRRSAFTSAASTRSVVSRLDPLGRRHERRPAAASTPARASSTSARRSPTSSADPSNTAAWTSRPRPLSCQPDQHFAAIVVRGDRANRREERRRSAGSTPKRVRYAVGTCRRS